MAIVIYETETGFAFKYKNKIWKSKKVNLLIRLRNKIQGKG